MGPEASSSGPQLEWVWVRGTAPFGFGAATSLVQLGAWPQGRAWRVHVRGAEISGQAVWGAEQEFVPAPQHSKAEKPAPSTPAPSVLHRVPVGGAAGLQFSQPP